LHHVMFDIDGTLVKSYDFDAECFVSAVKEVSGIDVSSDWSTYMHVTNTGILDEILDSNRVSNKQVIHNEIKSVFIQKIQKRIDKNPVLEVPGASSFLELLKSMDNIIVSLATGGWYESAALKLKSAGINFSDIPIASSNDDFMRTEIMKISALRATMNSPCSCTYFGDGNWDKMACEQLGYNFVLVGNKLEHKPNIIDFEPINEAVACIGL
jgi:phosphoglycolate phosphatase-like HAD superfamily hydrolase